MSVSGKAGVGIPLILLHDAEGGIITVEMKNGSMYRGLLEETQDTMNLTLKDCIKTNGDGSTQRVDIAYIRGSQVQFIVLPDMLANAPYFNRIKMWRKFKGHAVFGNAAVIASGRGSSANNKSQLKRPLSSTNPDPISSIQRVLPGQNTTAASMPPFAQHRPPSSTFGHYGPR